MATSGRFWDVWSVANSSEILLVRAADVFELFSLPVALQSQREAFLAHGRGDTQVQRALLDGPADSTTFSYASRLSADSGSVAKFGSVVPANEARGLPVVSAMVLALDGSDGRPVALLDGTAITAVRTSAASAVAAQALSVGGRVELAVIGTGVQGQAHVRALAHALELSSVRIWGPLTEQARQAATELTESLGLPVTAVGSARDAVDGAQVVVTCTTSATPVIDANWLLPGCTLISVGSFAADRCEVGNDLLLRADAIVVDDIPTACEQAGPIVSGLRDGTIAEPDLVSLGDVVCGQREARRADTDIVYYNSVGLGFQDAAAAWAIIAAARDQRRGQLIAW